MNKIAKFLQAKEDEIATVNSTLKGDLYLKNELVEKNKEFYHSSFLIQKSDDKKKGEYKLSIGQPSKDTGMYIDVETYNKLKPSINAYNEIKKEYKIWKNKKPIRNDEDFEKFRMKTNGYLNKKLIPYFLFNEVARLSDLH